MKKFIQSVKLWASILDLRILVDAMYMRTLDNLTTVQPNWRYRVHIADPEGKICFEGDDPFNPKPEESKFYWTQKDYLFCDPIDAIKFHNKQEFENSAYGGKRIIGFSRIHNYKLYRKCHN